MLNPVDALSLLCLLPILGGGAYSLLTPFTTQRFLARPLSASDFQPPVTVLKPVRGLEKDLKVNLRSMALQDYPDYQIIYAVQDPQDPALPLLQELQAEFGPEKVTVVVENIQAGANGKVNNLLGALTQARHEVLVISDSDTVVRPDYLKTIVAPLADLQVGCVCTPFKLIQAERWFEKLELLAINTDFMPSVLFAEVTGASKACLGPSLALRCSTLEALGGLASLADYLVEDFELGRRVWTNDQQLVLLPYFIEAVVDLANSRDWWRHQVYWDQNTYLARPWGFAATIIIKAVPFALLLVALRQGDALSWTILAVTLALRILSALSVAWQLKDWESIQALPWLPLREALAIIFWALAFCQRTVTWRGVQFKLTTHGKMVPLNLDS
ncbi:bacteriohopanetetrol glucosamine biosynthesis glycosyltransferase HpnI [Synechocystis sp. LKSZ1]|uniref:bacteriohopanetetrol glucosamine biosynthesis glycosyltransferase HpnI n=1 Tax=Synechocystis sp. LKSZ1 TaxID=3144951 RepID=UPI00336BB017